MEEEPNHTTGKKPGPLYTIQYRYSLDNYKFIQVDKGTRKYLMIKFLDEEEKVCCLLYKYKKVLPDCDFSLAGFWEGAGEHGPEVGRAGRQDHLKA